MVLQISLFSIILKHLGIYILQYFATDVCTVVSLQNVSLNCFIREKETGRGREWEKERGRKRDSEKYRSVLFLEDYFSI